MSVSGVEPRWWWVVVLAVLLLGLALLGRRIGKPLRNNVMPGLRSYVLAEDPREVRRILGSWAESGRAVVRRLLVLSFPSVVVRAAIYGTAAAVVQCRASSASSGPSTVDTVAVLGVAAIAAAVVAGVAGLIGNGALLVQLGSADRPRGGLVMVSLFAGRLSRALYWVIALYVLLGYGVLLAAR